MEFKLEIMGDRGDIIVDLPRKEVGLKYLDILEEKMYNYFDYQLCDIDPYIREVCETKVVISLSEDLVRGKFSNFFQNKNTKIIKCYSNDLNKFYRIKYIQYDSNGNKRVRLRWEFDKEYFLRYWIMKNSPDILY